MSKNRKYTKPMLAVTTGLVLVAGGLWGWNHQFSTNKSAYQAPSGQISIQPPGGLHPDTVTVHADPQGQQSGMKFYGQQVTLDVSATHGFAGQPIVLRLMGGDGTASTGGGYAPITFSWAAPKGSTVKPLTPILENRGSGPAPQFPVAERFVYSLSPATSGLNQHFTLQNASLYGAWEVIPPRGSSALTISAHLQNGWHRISIPLTTVSVPLGRHITPRLSGIQTANHHDLASFGLGVQWSGQGSMPHLPGTLIYSLNSPLWTNKPVAVVPSTSGNKSQSLTVPITPTSRGTITQILTASSQATWNQITGSSWTILDHTSLTDAITVRYQFQKLTINWAKLLLKDWYWILIAVLGLGSGIYGTNSFLVEKKARRLARTQRLNYKDLYGNPGDDDLNAR